MKLYAVAKSNHISADVRDLKFFTNKDNAEAYCRSFDKLQDYATFTIYDEAGKIQTQYGEFTKMSEAFFKQEEKDFFVRNGCSSTLKITLHKRNPNRRQVIEIDAD